MRAQAFRVIYYFPGQQQKQRRIYNQRTHNLAQNNVCKLCAATIFMGNVREMKFQFSLSFNNEILKSIARCNGFPFSFKI